MQGFDPQIFLNDLQNLFFVSFNSYEGGHCDPLNRTVRESPDPMIKGPTVGKSKQCDNNSLPHNPDL